MTDSKAYPDLSGPATDGFAVTPSNSTDFATPARALWVGTGGNVVLVTLAGTVLTFLNVPDGTLLPVRCSRVNSTSTTALNMVGLF